MKRRDLLDIVEAKAEAGRVRQAGLLLATVRKMFNWAVDSTSCRFPRRPA